MARTYALNIGLHYVKTRWAFQASDGSEHAEVVTLCCAIKPLVSWNLEKVASICRERCGGQVHKSYQALLVNFHSIVLLNNFVTQGYLSCNRFGTFIGLAHAAMTAEGDNSVLMQVSGMYCQLPRVQSC